MAFLDVVEAKYACAGKTLVAFILELAKHARLMRFLYDLIRPYTVLLSEGYRIAEWRSG